MSATNAQTNGKRTRAEAAAIAAATFAPDRKSLFDTARVSGAALKQALRDAAQRIVNSTPGIASTSTVSIVFAGAAAYVAHEWRGLNAKKELSVTAAIFLPDVDDCASIPRALCDEMLAMMLHELAHAFFTNDEAFKRGIHELARDHVVTMDRAKDVLNAIEDIRIERALMASGYAAGFRGIVGALLGRIMGEAIEGGALRALRTGDVTAMGFALAYGLRRTPDGLAYVVGGERLRPACDKVLGAAMDYVAANVYKIAADSQGTRKVYALADKVLGMLAQAGKQTAGDAGKGEPGTDGQPQPGDGQPQDGAQPGENGAQGDAAGDDEGNAQGSKGEAAEGDSGAAGEGDAGEGEAAPGEQSDGAADGEGDAADEGEATDGAGSESSAMPSGASAADEGKPPAPGTFTSEPRVMAIPVACQPTTAPQVFAPKVREPFPVSDEGMRRGAATLQDAQARMLNKGGALVSHLRRMFTRSDRDALETGRRHGRIRASALHRVATGADTVFAKRELVDGSSAACAVLIDGSGSMSHLAQMANGSALLLVHSLAKCAGVKTQVQVFQDGGDNSTITELTRQAASNVGIDARRQAQFTLRTFKRYDDAPAMAYSNAAPTAGGSTPDLEALAYVGRLLAKRPEPRKVLLFIADGGTNRQDAIMEECKHLKRMGVAVVAIGLMHDCRGFPVAVRVDDMSALAGAAMRQVCDAIGRAYEGAQ